MGRRRTTSNPKSECGIPQYVPQWFSVHWSEVIMIEKKVRPIQLPAESELPAWFEYPPQLPRLIENGLTRFPPWKIFEGEYVVSRMRGLRDRFPGRELVPFAARLDCDDIACWERGKMPVVLVIHDFAAAGWEQRTEFKTFWSGFAPQSMISSSLSHKKKPRRNERVGGAYSVPSCSHPSSK